VPASSACSKSWRIKTAADIKLRAERRAGELLDLVPKHPGSRNLGKSGDDIVSPPKLVEAAEKSGGGIPCLADWHPWHPASAARRSMPAVSSLAWCARISSTDARV
jgi:hypothetical protein